MNRSIFLTALACAVLPGCVRWDAVDAAFCDADETCERGPEEHFCGQTRCVDAVAFGECVAAFTCNAEGRCEGVERKPGYDPGPCTVNTCEGGEWNSRPYTAEELDDGNPCTIDECDPVFGPTHVNAC